MECPVCYTNNVNLTMCCGHSICKDCAKQWYLKASSDPSCPMCRQPMQWKGLYKNKESWEEERLDLELENVWTKTAESILEFDHPILAMHFLEDAHRRFNILKNDTWCDSEYMEYVLSVPYWMPDLIEIPKEYYDYGLYLLRNLRPMERLAFGVNRTHNRAPITA